MPPPSTSEAVVAALDSFHSADELRKVRRRLDVDEPAIGMRMRDLFDTAKAHLDLPLDEIDRLLEHSAYEPRMAAFCILDFQVRKRLTDDERGARHDLYLARHDRITTWDMVDRAAPRVVGGHLVGRSQAGLDELAASPDPLRRRTAITAPLFYVKAGAAAELAHAFTIADGLCADPEPSVHNAVGIFLKHAGGRMPERLHQLLDGRAPVMPRPALRLAIEKLSPVDRQRYLAAR